MYRTCRWSGHLPARNASTTPRGRVERAALEGAKNLQKHRADTWFMAPRTKGQRRETKRPIKFRFSVTDRVLFTPSTPREAARLSQSAILSSEAETSTKTLASTEIEGRTS
ncbi:hypothetical protein E2C01_027926 [Portunus trituberculatus]|uniref:Uncharacterized protein n=1 Tax=Portunus trituberculatus TaxID=210409 RepID=A0A5B7EM86_PORTR|nr:hypothetical protein [Portunus trituberculatus]